MNAISSPGVAPQSALLFIPDISGFTRFVSDTEIHHAQHIINELLEILVDSNEIDLQLSEIEGDAILFYRFGTAPTAAELLTQVQRMFVRFHTHLKKYETHRVCNCGACRSAHSLSLKFVAHYGPTTLHAVRQHQKLFGKDVIVAHRLLKNGINEPEYALFTHTLVQACPQWVDVETAGWAPIAHGEEDFDSGKTTFCYLPLSPLMEHLPALQPEDYSIPGVKVQVMESQAEIRAPMETVFNIVSDLPWRSQWIKGSMPKVVDLNSLLAQEGQTHRCLAKGPVLVSHDIEVGEDRITFTETDQKRSMCVVYTLTRLDEQRTQAHAVAFMRKNFLMQLMFRLLIKKKFQQTYTDTWANLNAYCDSLHSKMEEHPYRLVLTHEAPVVG